MYSGKEIGFCYNASGCLYPLGNGHLREGIRMKLTLIVLLAATCLDSFVVMMERGSSMREMKRTKGAVMR